MAKIDYMHVVWNGGPEKIYPCLNHQYIPPRNLNPKLEGSTDAPAKFWLKLADGQELWIPAADVCKCAIIKKRVVRVVRFTESNEGTFGSLSIDGWPFCNTLEPPDLDNQKNISSIPAGVYLAKRIMSPKYGETFEIADVPNRTHILIHPGNVVNHTKGCLILGQYFGKLMHRMAVLNSGKTFDLFKRALAEVDSFIYEVTEAIR